MISNPLQPFFDQVGVVILDGALATELERRGADLHDPLWSAKVLLEQPALIRQVHYDYFAAGADVVTTASYQATFAGFAQRGLTQEQAADLMRLSVQLAQAARDEYWNSTSQSQKSQIQNRSTEDFGEASSELSRTLSRAAHERPKLKPLVAASVGPYGAFLADGSEYHGDYGLSVAELIDFHRPRMQVLVEAGADLLACETIPCQAEAEALVQLLTEFPQTVAWLSFSCRDDEHIAHGESFAECVALVSQSQQIVAVGLNCTAPRFVELLLQCAAPVTTKPLVAYPNSGERWDAATNCWLPGTGVTEFGEPARCWYRAGARLLGGCCRTTPADIQTIALALHV